MRQQHRKFKTFLSILGQLIIYVQLTIWLTYYQVAEVMNKHESVVQIFMNMWFSELFWNYNLHWAKRPGFLSRMGHEICCMLSCFSTGNCPINFCDIIGAIILPHDVRKCIQSPFDCFPVVSSVTSEKEFVSLKLLHPFIFPVW